MQGEKCSNLNKVRELTLWMSGGVFYADRTIEAKTLTLVFAVFLEWPGGQGGRRELR